MHGREQGTPDEHSIDIRGLIARPRFVQSTDGPEVHWDLGTLQFAPAVTGPWTDLPAASPFPLSPIGEQRFFRVKVLSFAECSEDGE